MRLLLDLGNTRLKWGLHDDATGLHGVAAQPWDDAPADALQRALASVPAPSAVYGASVVDTAREERIAALVHARFDLPVVWRRTPRAACGVRNAYATPGDLGVDRFLAMVAAYAAGLVPCVLASAGTALTLDALAADGRHLGGLIAPGVGLMQRSVRSATARVQPEAGALADAAVTTADALHSGCWQACAALVDRFATRMAAPLGGAPQLLVGGGDARALLPLLEHPGRLFADPVLHGLIAWADLES